MFIILSGIVLFFTFFLYTCLCVRTPYDREIDDIEQTKFLEEYLKKKNQKR